MRRSEETEAISSGLDYLAISHPFGGAKRQTIIDTHHLAHHTTHRFRVWSELLPLGHCRAFVGLKMTESDPTQSLRIDERCHGGFDLCKERPRTGMEQQRLLIAHQELTELNIERFNECCDAE